MLDIKYSNRFKKDLKSIKKQNKYNIDELKYVIKKLVNQEKLERKYNDHVLNGEYNGFRECHIRPDWLLIYLREDNGILLSRTGSHSELF